MRKIIIPFLLIAFLCSCESEQARNERIQFEEQQRIELQERKIAEEKAEAERIEKERRERERIAEIERIEREERLEKERKEREIYERYINNSLSTGSTPWSQYYGGNSGCNDYGCSEIKVRTPRGSDVIVTIKKNEKVVRHAYIRASSSYTFSFPNGTYQAFFYYGNGWNPEKEMKNGEMKGGFIADESFSKDYPQTLRNQILEYELILQTNGNFSTKPSNSEEAL